MTFKCRYIDPVSAYMAMRVCARDFHVSILHPAHWTIWFAGMSIIYCPIPKPETATVKRTVCAPPVELRCRFCIVCLPIKLRPSEKIPSVSSTESRHRSMISGLPQLKML